MRESCILSIYSSKSTVFTFKDIALLCRETNVGLVKRKVYRYVKSGKLYSIRKGIYAKDKNYNKLELATKIYTPSYVSLETVLSREGVIFQYYDTVFVVSYLTRTISCDGQTYVFKKIKSPALTNPLGIEKKENYSIASRERAFMDALYLYKDYHFDNTASINWGACFEMLPMYGNRTLAKKLNAHRKRAGS